MLGRATCLALCHVACSLEDSIGVSIVVNVAAKVGIGIGQRRNGDNDCNCNKLHDCALSLMVDLEKTNGKLV